jgi:ABC-2 type transport system ATP-binding protein
VLVEEKAALMKKLGKKQLTLTLHDALKSIPEALGKFDLELGQDGNELIHTFDATKETTSIADLLKALDQAGVEFTDLQTKQSSLEEIFVDLVRRPK